MKSNIINISGYSYYTELFDADIDLKSSPHYDNFVMLRLFDIKNNITIDTDIYFIEKSLFDEIANDFTESTSTVTDKIAFPIHRTPIHMFSSNAADFDDNYTYDNIDAYVYYLYDSTGKQLKSISCNKLKIYHPAIKSRLDAIIYIDNYINNIHFHYLCRRIDTYSTKSEQEIRIGNNIYSEYVEVWFPNIYSLFKKNISTGQYDTYYIEDMNLIVAPENEDFMKRMTKKIEDDDEDEYNSIDDIEDAVTKDIISELSKSDVTENSYVNVYDGIQMCPLELIIHPSHIVETTKDDVHKYYKLYINPIKTIETNYITYPINVTIYPYEYNDENSHMYIVSDTLVPDTETYTTDCRIGLAAHMGFNDGHIAIVTNFTYPNKEDFEDASRMLRDFKTLHKQEYDALYSEYPQKYHYYNPVSLMYLYYNNVSAYDYNKFVAIKKEQLFKNINSITTLTKNDKLQVQQFLDNFDASAYDIDDENARPISTTWADIKNDDDKILDAYKFMKRLAIENELREQMKTSIDFIGFKITIASDKNFKNIIYDSYYPLEFSDSNDIYEFELDDFAFALNGIFTSWNEMPEHLIAECSFIDRYLGRIIKSNFVPITKEWFKYMISDRSKNKLYDLHTINYNMKTIDISNTDNTFNFLNNITCVIKKSTEGSSSISGTSNGQRILLKPYFYKVNNAQNIQVRTGFKQNIGINLADYMTKVDVFHMYIDGNNFVEIGRNDMYVIFEVNALTISNRSGVYDIADDDGNYITSGNYNLY